MGDAGIPKTARTVLILSTSPLLASSSTLLYLPSFASEGWMKSVTDVLKDTRNHGFTEHNTSQGNVGPISSFESRTDWIPPDLHGLYKWVKDALALLSVCVSTRSSKAGKLALFKNGLIGSARILHVILTSGSVRTLSTCAFPGSGILVQPALIDAHFRKAWMPYFRRDGHEEVTSQAFLNFVGEHAPPG